MTQINGLLTQKPDSPAPVAGNVQNFWWQEITGRPGKQDYVKVGNPKQENPGVPCEVISAEKTDYVDAHQNVSFNVSFTPQDDAAGAVGGVGGEKANGSVAPAAPSDKDAQIARAVAFKGAVRVVAYEVQTGKCEPEDVAAKVEALTSSLLPILGAADPKAEAPKTGGGAGAAMDSDIPFA